jgi:hypothetical protein
MQAVRPPRGGPETGVQVPVLPATSHASHWPVQGVSQQKPSTQVPVAHRSSGPHGCPMFRIDPPGGTHWPPSAKQSS